MPPILRERLIWQRMTRNTNTVKITAWGAVCIWNATSIAVGRFQKERIYDLEKFIKRYTHTAGDEANIYLKAPLKESAAKQPTTFADLSTLNLETVEYSEKVIGVFGDTKLIKDVLKGLNDLFSVRTSSITVKGVRDGYTAGSRKYVRHSQCMPMHRDEKGRAVCSTLPIKIYSYENEQECTEEQQSSEIRERNGSESNRFGNHPQTDDITLTAKRTHNCRSGGANHAQDTACNGNG